MANTNIDNSKKISELATTTNVASTDRIVVLYNAISNAAIANGTPQVRTIPVDNFTSNLRYANTTVAGIIKVGNYLSINATGYLTINSVPIDLTSISSDIIPSANNSYSLGNTTHQWKDLHVSSNTIYIGGTPLSVNNGTLLVNNAPVTANVDTGNVVFTQYNAPWNQTYPVITTKVQYDLNIVGNNSPVNISSNQYVQLVYSEDGSPYGGGNNQSYYWTDANYNGQYVQAVNSAVNSYAWTQKEYWANGTIDTYGIVSNNDYDFNYSYSFSPSYKANGYGLDIKPFGGFDNTLTVEPTADYDIHLYESYTNGAITLGKYGQTNFRVYGPGGANNGGGQYGNDIRAELAANSTFLIRTYDNQSRDWKFQANGTLINPDGLNIRTPDFDPYTDDANGQIYLNPTYYSEDPDQGSADFIDTNVALTRANQYGLFNALLDYPSPQGTLWNSDGWSNLTNVQNRKYITFFASANGKLGVNVINKYFIMKDTVNNKYYKIQFTVWQQGGGGNFTYTRQQIDGVTGANIGSPVTFVKTANGQQDNIDTNISITRNSNQGIYNIDLEPGWNNTQPDSPANTEWNSDGWQDLSDVKTRNYTTLYNVANRYGYLHGQELVMHDTANDKYYTFKFSGWQAGGNGGAFSYERKLINTNLFFAREDGSNDSVVAHVDHIAPGISMARGSGGIIYNSESEGGWNSDVSPQGTMWNADGWDDLSNITTRQYVTLWSSFKAATGLVILDQDFVMHDTINDEYWAIKFTRWQQGINVGGPQYPGFSYIRRKLKPEQHASGVAFADGTFQNKAVTALDLGVNPQEKVSAVRRYLTRNDVGKHLYIDNANNNWIGIPDSSKVAMPLGATITIINRSGNNVNIVKENDYDSGSIFLSGSSLSNNQWTFNDAGGGNYITLKKTADYWNANSNQKIVEWTISTDIAGDAAANAYTNAMSFANDVAANAYSNSIAYTDNKTDNAYSNAINYTNSKFGNVVISTNNVFYSGIEITSEQPLVLRGNNYVSTVINTTNSGFAELWWHNRDYDAGPVPDGTSVDTDFYVEGDGAWLVTGKFINSTSFDTRIWHWGMDGMLDIPSNGDIRRDGVSLFAQTYSNATSYASDVAANAYSNAVSYANNIAANAYSNAISYADDKAANAYTNAVSYANSTFQTSAGLNANIASYLVDGTNKVITGNTITLNGNVVVNGNTDYFVANNIIYSDAIIELHAPGANVSNTWTFDDGKDVGIRFHYYNSGDKNAALVLADDTKYLEWYVDGSENANGVFSGTYGTIKANVFLGTATSANNSTYLSGNTVSDLNTYSDNKAANAYANAIAYSGNAAQAYSNATSYADTKAATAYSNAIAYSGNAAQAYSNATTYSSNATNITSGTLNTARLPTTANISTAVNVGANINISTTQITVGNATVNTVITSTNISGIGTGITNVNAATVGGNSALDLTTYADNKAANAYSNAIAYSGNAAQAYSNAVTYVGAQLFVNTSQLSSNLANYVTATNLTNNLANYQTTAGLNANIAAYLPTYTGIVNGSSFTVGTTTTVNSTAVYVSNTSGNVTISPYGVTISANGNGFVALGNTTVNTYITSSLIRTTGNAAIGTATSVSGATLTVNGAVQSANLIVSAKTQAYTLTANDSGTTITVSNTGATTITVPASLPVGFRCMVMMINTGNVVIGNAIGVTLNSRTNNYTVSSQWGSASVFVYAANSVIVDGSI